MAAFIPQGLNTRTGQIGVDIDPTTGLPLAAVIEVMDTLPPLSDSSNFSGRTIYLTTTMALYVFISFGPSWMILNGTGVVVGAVKGTPPVFPSTRIGQLYFDTDTQVIFLWNGVEWLSIGGNLGAAIKTQVYTSGGTVFPLGISQTTTNDFVELYLDGVRQTPSKDYSVTGNAVITINTIDPGVTVLVRTTQTAPLVPNSQVYTTNVVVNYPMTPNKNFPLNMVGVDSASTMVFVGGNLKLNNIDYVINTQDTSIASIIYIGTTTGGNAFRATTSGYHGLNINDTTMINGGALPFNNLIVSITNIPSPNTFDFVINTTLKSVTATSMLYFYPPTQSDTVSFTNNLNYQDVLTVKYFKSVMLSSNYGEINALSSIGTGISVSAGKVGTLLQTKTLLAGNNVTLADNGTTITINSKNDHGYINRITLNSAMYAPDDTISYIGVTNTNQQVIIDLSNIITSPTNAYGRTLTIKDESGHCSINSIVLHFGADIMLDGISTFSLNQNYGYVTITTDGYHWFKIGGSN